eukprot:scaffold119109_cov68-Phaeocystis_antarctica.AAC.13
MVGGVRPESLRSPLPFSFPDGAAMGQPAATPWLSMMAPGTLSSQSAVGLGFPSSNPVGHAALAEAHALARAVVEADGSLAVHAPEVVIAHAAGVGAEAVAVAVARAEKVRAVLPLPAGFALTRRLVTVLAGAVLGAAAVGVGAEQVRLGGVDPERAVVRRPLIGADALAALARAVAGADARGGAHAAARHDLRGHWARAVLAAWPRPSLAADAHARDAGAVRRRATAGADLDRARAARPPLLAHARAPDAPAVRRAAALVGAGVLLAVGREEVVLAPAAAAVARHVTHALALPVAAAEGRVGHQRAGGAPAVLARVAERTLAAAHGIAAAVPVALAGARGVDGLAAAAAEAAPAVALAEETVAAARAVEGVRAAQPRVFILLPLPLAQEGSLQSEVLLRNGGGGGSGSVGLDRALPRGTKRGALVEHGTKQRCPHINLCSPIAGIALPALGARAIAAKAHAVAGAMRRASVHVACCAAPARSAGALAPRAHARLLDPNGRALDAPAVPRAVFWAAARSARLARYAGEARLADARAGITPAPAVAEGRARRGAAVVSSPACVAPTGTIYARAVPVAIGRAAALHDEEGRLQA